MAMKQCPICRLEQSDENQSCQACGAVFDDSPQGATMPEIPDDEAAPNGEESEEETEEESEEAE